MTAFFIAIHARFIRELAPLPAGVEVIVFSGGGEPSGEYRDFSASANLIEEGRAEVAAVLDRYAGTSQDLARLPRRPHRPPSPPSPPPPRPRRDHPPRCGPALSTGRYLLSNDAPEAMDRFTAFTTLFDPATFRHSTGWASARAGVAGRWARAGPRW